MLRCLSFLADSPEGDVGCRWSRCHMVRNPVLTLLESEPHSVLHAGNKSRGLTFLEGMELLQGKKCFMQR